MKNFSKYILSILIILSLFSCSRFKAQRDADKNKQQQTTQKPEAKDQYRMIENFSGNKSQMIDLIAGPATFEIKYEGSSHFLAVIIDQRDGKVLDTLANMTGTFNGTKEITVPETTGYILDVRCEGLWSIYRK
jgi:PBP1b-binding outer membrane lipoprotein LpoB